ncbi:MAG: type II toxin-antitoxin system prevent-host-death family antitoxin [Deltaproteobacteria bacterium]|nr:type II toxin-antitoxin system prevent-host-death family antitoxin [Deltaproteobacteria bacterium]
MGSSVGIRELRSDASAIVRRVRQGEVVTVTDRHRPVAVIVPLRSGSAEDAVRQLVRLGRVAWAGGKPAGSRRRAVLRGPTVAEAVVEDRR